MVKEGRTMAQARAAGTLYRLQGFGWTEALFPAAETPQEALNCIKFWQDRRGNPVPSGTVFKVDRLLPGGRIGCEYVEELDPVIA